MSQDKNAPVKGIMPDETHIYLIAKDDSSDKKTDLFEALDVTRREVAELLLSIASDETARISLMPEIRRVISAQVQQDNAAIILEGTLPDEQNIYFIEKFLPLPSKTKNLLRKGLENEEKIKATLINSIPYEVRLGKADDQGDCFFDALAQMINAINNTEVHTIKSLRELCHGFYAKNTELVNGWNKNENNYHLVRYTAKECEQQHNQAPIWGRAYVEGKILCRQLNLEGLCMLEILQDPETQNPVLSFHLVDRNDYKNISAQQAQLLFNNPKIPILVVEQNSLHFVPLIHPLAFPQSSLKTPPIEQSFQLFNISRADAVAALMALSEDSEVRKFLAPEIKQTFLANLGNLPTAMYAPWQKLYKKEQRAQAGIETTLKLIKSEFLTKDSVRQNYSAEQMLIYLNEMPEYQEAASLLSKDITYAQESKKALENYCTQLDVYQDFVQYGLGTRVDLGACSAILLARTQHKTIYIWEKNQDLQVKLKYYNNAPRARQPIHLLLTDSMQFNLLEQTLAPEKKPWITKHWRVHYQSYWAAQKELDNFVNALNMQWESLQKKETLDDILSWLKNNDHLQAFETLLTLRVRVTMAERKLEEHYSELETFNYYVQEGLAVSLELGVYSALLYLKHSEAADINFYAWRVDWNKNRLKLDRGLHYEIEAPARPKKIIHVLIDLQQANKITQLTPMTPTAEMVIRESVPRLSLNEIELLALDAAYFDRSELLTVLLGPAFNKVTQNQFAVDYNQYWHSVLQNYALDMEHRLLGETQIPSINKLLAEITLENYNDAHLSYIKTTLIKTISGVGYIFMEDFAKRLKERKDGYCLWEGNLVDREELHLNLQNKYREFKISLIQRRVETIERLVISTRQNLINWRDELNTELFELNKKIEDSFEKPDIFRQKIELGTRKKVLIEKILQNHLEQLPVSWSRNIPQLRERLLLAQVELALCDGDGNTLLHIAYARRNILASRLLTSFFKLKETVLNKANQSPQQFAGIDEQEIFWQLLRNNRRETTAFEKQLREGLDFYKTEFDKVKQGPFKKVKELFNKDLLQHESLYYKLLGALNQSLKETSDATVGQSLRIVLEGVKQSGEKGMLIKMLKDIWKEHYISILSTPPLPRKEFTLKIILRSEQEAELHKLEKAEWAVEKLNLTARVAEQTEIAEVSQQRVISSAQNHAQELKAERIGFRSEFEAQGAQFKKILEEQDRIHKAEKAEAERIRHEERVEAERIHQQERAEAERINKAEKAEAERIRQEERAEAERTRQAEKSENDIRIAKLEKSIEFLLAELKKKDKMPTEAPAQGFWAKGEDDSKVESHSFDKTKNM